MAGIESRSGSEGRRERGDGSSYVEAGTVSPDTTADRARGREKLAEAREKHGIEAPKTPGKTPEKAPTPEGKGSIGEALAFSKKWGGRGAGAIALGSVAGTGGIWALGGAGALIGTIGENLGILTPGLAEKSLEAAWGVTKWFWTGTVGQSILMAGGFFSLMYIIPWIIKKSQEIALNKEVKVASGSGGGGASHGAGHGH